MPRHLGTLAAGCLAGLGWVQGGQPAGLDPLAELGRRLFFDPELSADRSVSCASCHKPEHSFADREALSLGARGARTRRNAPSLLNRELEQAQFWDGRAHSLSEQVLMPIQDEREMALPLPEALARLCAHAEYPELFRRGLGAEPSADGLARALSAYVVTLRAPESAVDRFRRGEVERLSTEERGGLWLFESSGRCWRCHAGANFSDESFHDTGAGARGEAGDPGRMAASGDPADRGRFKTPTLRGVAASAPYMHDGSLATLEEVVEFYRKAGGASPGRDPILAEIRLEPEDVPRLAAFLRALSRPAE